jgi:hypothetical protein
MSPEERNDPDGSEPTLPPADDARIRHLLAEARHTDPMPDDVAARLDRVLAGLSQEREERLAPVVELASRRRRTAASLLVAAAAVVVVGVGISQVLPDHGLGGSGGGDAATSTQEDAAGGDAARAPEPSRDDGSAAAPGPESAPADRALVQIRSAHFGQDVRRARSTASARGPQGFVAYPPADGCLGVDPGSGSLLPVSYDGAPAYLVLRPPAGDTQVVDLYLCGDTASRRSITLTAP